MSLSSVNIYRPRNTELNNSYVILCNTKDAASSFLDIFNKTRHNRNARGAPTDEEQDLLRAMLIFSSSGLDSMVKQIIIDGLEKIIFIHQGALEMFKKFVERRLKRKDEFDYKFLANIIADKNPQNILVNELIEELTSNSIQSVDQLFKVFSFFDIASQSIIDNPELLRKIFKTRNEIAHEMDVDFSQPNRNRRPRSRQDMIKYTKTILIVASTLLRKVDEKL